MNDSFLLKLSNKKRGSGETIDLNSILSLDNKKKRVSKKKKTKQDKEKDQNQAIEKEIKNQTIDDGEDVLKSEKKGEEIKDINEENDNNDGNDDDPIDYSKPIQWNEINIDKLNYKKLEDIKFISNSIGVFKSGLRKHDLIDKIKGYIQMNKEIIENKIKKDNINPFNKNTFGSLVIPNGKDGHNELLFWKVFKNKSIFKYIMSYIDKPSHSIQFDHIISVDSMLENNQINILKEKVKLGKYLTFISSSNTIFDFYDNHEIPFTYTDTWVKLFLDIQDDKQFYRNLFKNYDDQIPFENFDNKYQNILKKIVKSNCIAALQVLIEDFSFIPTIDHLIYSFINCKPKSFKIFLPLITKKEIEKNRSKLEESTLKSYKKHISHEDLIETVICVCSLFKNNKKAIITGLISEICYIVFTKDIILKTLVDVIGLLDTFNYWEDFIKLAIKFQFPWHTNKSFSKQEADSLVNEFKNKIKSLEFSKEQLESSVYHPINYQSKENKIINKLLNIRFIIYLPNSPPYYMEYFICYAKKLFVFNDGFKLSSLIPHSFYDSFPYYKVILEHADYEIFLMVITNLWSNTVNLHSLLYKSNEKNQNNGIIFSKCTNKELQIQFIDKLIEDIKSSSQYQLHPLFLLLLLVKNNDLELVKRFVSQVDKELIAYPNLFKKNLTVVFNEKSVIDNIKSTKVLEYLYNEFVDFSFSNEISDSEFLECLTKFFTKKGQGLDYILSYEPTKSSVSFIVNALENPSIFKISEIVKFRPTDLLNENKEIYFQTLKNTIEKYPNKFIDPILYYKKSFTMNPQKEHIDFFKWFQKFSSKNDYLPKNDLKINLMNYIFDNMENDKLFQDDDSFTIGLLEKYTYVIKFASVRVDLKILERILTICENKYSLGNREDQVKIKMIILNSILFNAIINQQIFLLEYLLLNHPHIFKKKIESKSKTTDNSKNNNNFRNGIFTQNELRELVFLSLKNYNIKITNFLLSIITITKIQLETHSCPQTYYHLKDRFK
ncbi:hypothetical protein RB653_010381 [Dictyostelium firmibasis]|uniref:Uncharacterized protein n=1 Tax=Dictyostelium firmibasis TaxID=79012 RepID=A0AAN7TT08_9MYCE